MQVTISWRHREHSKVLDEYINKKLAHLEKFSRRISNVSVIVEQEGARNLVELQIKLEKAPNFLVKQQNYNMREAVDNCITKAERKIRHYEEKIRDKKK